MMKTKLVLLAAFTLGACAEGPQPSEHAIKQECRLELETARTAIHLRDQGKTKQAMLQTLPPLTPTSSRLLQQMYHVIDEVYAFPGLNEIVYGTYRYEYCVHQLQQQSVPRQLQDVFPHLLACQSQYGMTVSKQVVACVRAAFPNSTNTQAPVPAN